MRACMRGRNLVNGPITSHLVGGNRKPCYHGGVNHGWTAWLRSIANPWATQAQALEKHRGNRKHPRPTGRAVPTGRLVTRSVGTVQQRELPTVTPYATNEHYRAGAVYLRKANIADGYESATKPPSGKRSEGDIAKFSSDSAKRYAARFGCFLDGVNRCLFVTLTLGRHWQNCDWSNTQKNLHRWLKRNGWAGFMLNENQLRGALHKHGYLVHPDGMAAWPALRDYWLKAVKSTGALEQGQDCQVLRSNEAGINYMLRHGTKKNQQDFRGRRWAVINPVLVDELSTELEPVEDEVPGLWCGWFWLASVAMPFSANLFANCAAGWVPRWFVGEPPRRQFVMAVDGPRKAHTWGWQRVPPVDSHMEPDGTIVEHQMDPCEELDCLESWHGPRDEWHGKKQKRVNGVDYWLAPVSIKWSTKDGTITVAGQKFDGQRGRMAASHLQRWSTRTKAQRMVEKAGIKAVRTLTDFGAVVLPAEFQLPGVWTVPKGESA